MPRFVLPRFMALYAALYASFGVASPFLPGLLMQDGLTPGALSVVLAGGAAIRLVTGPAGGRLADLSGRAPLVLATLTAIAAAVALAYAPARGVALLLLVSVAHAAVLAPLTPIADSLALGAAARRPGFEYGWVRGVGSAAFIAGLVLSGQMVGRWGLGVVVWLNAGLLAIAAACALLAPNRPADTHGNGGRQAQAPRPRATDLRATDLRATVASLASVSVFVRLMLVAALVGGSHALHDSFEVIRWQAAGLTPAQASQLWSLSVAGEVGVFFLAGPWLIARLGPGRAAALAALAGVVRWSAAALTANFWAMAAVEPLHGLTFALLHLACMDVIARAIPARHAATAQAIYGTVALGATSALITLAAGPLYAWSGPAAWWPMAALCAAAVPLALSVRA